MGLCTMGISLKIIYYTPGNYVKFAIKIIMISAFSNNDQPFYILIDSALCHTTEAFKKALQTPGINLNYVPLLIKNILQRANVAWMKSLKQSYKDLLDNL